MPNSSSSSWWSWTKIVLLFIPGVAALIFWIASYSHYYYVCRHGPNDADRELRSDDGVVYMIYGTDHDDILDRERTYWLNDRGITPGVYSKYIHFKPRWKHPISVVKFDVEMPHEYTHETIIAINYWLVVLFLFIPPIVSLSFVWWVAGRRPEATQLKGTEQSRTL